MGAIGEAATWAGATFSEDRVTASTILDPDSLPFLLDHQVGASVLLPTALQLGLVLAAIRSRVGTVRPDSGVSFALSDLTVEDPVLLLQGSPSTVRVEGVLPLATGAGRFAIRSTAGLRHLTLHAALVPDNGVSGSERRSVAPDLPGDAALVYPPMFHGPAFQVIDRFGRLGSDLVTQLRHGLPSWDDVAPGSGQAAQLIELLFQSCGVWELTESGRMMRPLYVERLIVSPRAFEPLTDVRAEVRPSTTTPSGFDGEVLDAAGHVLVQLTGYRPVELSPASPEVVARFQTVQPTHHTLEPSP